MKAAQSAARILNNAGVETRICLPFSPEGNDLKLPKQVVLSDMQEELPTADILVCFGGDGTILHAAKDANEYGIPILGVNLGSVGFMAEVEQSELSLLSKLAVGKYAVESRMMIQVEVRREGRIIYSDLALNDAVITKGAVARVVDMEVRSDKVPITSFSGDGVIVSTPTGSTAYSMSAGGPIVEPTAENIIVTPICPHVVNARSVVLDHRRNVTIRMRATSRKTAYLSVDGGKAFKLSGGDIMHVRQATAKTHLIRLTSRSFFDIMTQKLGRM
nr:NAD(+)/NADH kinase [Pseudoflavonifractor sp. MSJ-37]